jgi:predicted lipid-binding transport protein (Tim44 family)
MLDALTGLLPIAAAGGGSSGFGGGGGGGGFGGGGGGGGGFYVGGGGGGGWFFPVLIIAAVVVLLLFGVYREMRYNRRKRERVRQVELASAEAAEDDPRFAAERVTRAGIDLFNTVQHAWDARDRETLRGLCSGDLLVEWERRLDDFERRGWHNRVRVVGGPTVEYVGLVNREGVDDDRVVVRIEAKLEDFVQTRGGGRMNTTGDDDGFVDLVEYWTLAPLGETGWRLVSIEQKAEGDHHLEGAIVASPWADARVADAALVETAVADAAPADVKTSEIADLDFDGDARAAALDLSLADARFAPDVLEVAVRRAVEAWAEAIDGPDTALAGIATPDAIDALLYPGDPEHETRLVVRGPVVQQVRIAALDAAAEPPTMSVDVTVQGARYIENRDTAAVLAGSKQHRTSFTEHWTFALDANDAAQPWRVAGAAKVAV